MGERSLGTLMVSLIVVIAAAIGLYAYYSWSTAQAKELALDFSLQYRGLVDRNATFESRWQTFSKRYRCTHDDSTYDRCVRYFLRDPQSRQDYNVLRQFFNSVGTCAQAKLCDFDTARSLFGDDVVAFYNNMYPMLADGGAQGLIDFAERIEYGDQTPSVQTSEPGPNDNTVYTTPSQQQEEQPSWYQRVKRWWNGSGDRRRD